jgi:SAM-dependent methyltransferase
MRALDNPAAAWKSPEVPLPSSLTLADIERTWHTWSVNGEPPGHLDVYAEDSKLRFLHTWGLIQGASGRCLELGASPYFSTWLLENYTDLELTLANYFGRSGECTETVSWIPPGASERVEVRRESLMFNIEQDRFPYEDDSFEVVLFCELIEHLLMDPVAALREIRRVLVPGGVLVLTTPNVARLENVFQLVEGMNLYDPYSGHGPYGRHNREYTRHELHRLLEFAGFEVEFSMTADGHPTGPPATVRMEQAARTVAFRQPDLGQYLFVRARAVPTARTGLPSFLYRSYGGGEVVAYE